MKLFLTILLLVCLAAIAVSAQNQPERRVIEVNGSAEQLIVPNEFTFKITLTERVENKKKITIEEQEDALRTELSRLGIDVVKDLSIYDISSTYFRQRKLKDVLGTKDYRLKIRDLEKIAQLQDLADRINVSKLDLISTDNTEMVKYRKETKIAAIKAAREKAQYLLEAIGSKLGMPVNIDEKEEGSTFIIDGQEVSNFRTGTLNSNNSVAFSSGRTDDSPTLSFSATKIRFVIRAKFEIE